ncbi:NINE protein [Dokdonia sp. Asnod2-E02]|uniref:NINE protein n=2 Tax=Dokdonia TaxID=326319 RepID=UPI00386FF422
MSTEDNKIPGDKPENDGKRMADDAKDAVNDFAEDAKETAKEFGDSAKEAAGNVKEEWNKMTGSTENKKVLAGILAIVLGGFGIHKFILGYQKEGIIMLAVNIVGWFLCGIPSLVVWAVGVIEGIMYLTKSDEEFYNTYQAGRKPWF